MHVMLVAVAQNIVLTVSVICFSMKSLERTLWTCLMACSLSCCWIPGTTALLLLVMLLESLPSTWAGVLMVIFLYNKPCFFVIFVVNMYVTSNHFCLSKSRLNLDFIRTERIE